MDLDDRLETLRGASADLAVELRRHALAVDADPADLSGWLDLFAFRMIRRSNTPRHLQDEPLRIGRWTYDSSSLLATVVSLVEVAQGDAGMVMACPGPALAGVLVDRIGSPAQQEAFHGALADGRTWAFFGMTEPERGNDATHLTTVLERDGADGFRLRGAKRYIGSGSRGGIGVVFARTGKGPLSIQAVLVRVRPAEGGGEPTPGFAARPLDMIGLRGARLAELELDGLAVPADAVLGGHLPPARRGMAAAMGTFSVMRVQIAAMAVGTGLAMHALVREHRPAAPGLDEVGARLEACRQLVYEAAAAVERDPGAGDRASLAKIVGTRLGLVTARWATARLGPGSLVEHPLLEKWTRDVRAFEFMEGTTNIQRGHLTRAHLRGTHARAVA